MTNDFGEAYGTWLEGAQAIINDYYAQQFPTLTPSVLTTKVGRRYVKVVVTNDGGKGQASVHTFVDKTTGDVLKPAGWSAPAKHARGNIFDSNNGLGSMDPYGPAYLR